MNLLARPVRSVAMAAATAALLVSAAACGGGSEDSANDKASATPSASESAETPADSGDIPGGVLTVGDKSVFLDGFIGLRVPEGWSVTSAEVPLLSKAPPGEQKLDETALAQALVINPDASPRGATFSLVHYEHSDAVPDLDKFDTAVAKLLSGDGSQVAEASTVTIGKQDGRLHQVKSASGSNGVLITLKAGDEYFFILSLVTESSYAADTGDMLASVSFVPEVLHS